MQLSNGGILRLLQSMQQAGSWYGKFLEHYPSVLCEPLEVFYRCRRGMCSLDDELLQDLLFSFSWREANWGAWLSALAPRASYLPYLQQRAASLPYGTKVINLALAACGDPLNKEVEVHYPLMQDVVGMLNKLPVIKCPMRRSLTEEEQTEFNSGVERIREMYRAGGIAAAKLYIKMSPLNYYLMSHDDWLKAGAPARTDTGS